MSAISSLILSLFTSSDSEGVFQRNNSFSSAASIEMAVAKFGSSRNTDNSLWHC